MVSACVTDPVTLPDFDVAKRADVEVTDPTPLPMLCDVPFETALCYQILEAFDDIAYDNTEIAYLNAGIVRDGEAAYDLVLAAGKKQQEVGQIRQEMLEQERQDHFWDNVWHRGLILVLAVGMIL